VLSLVNELPQASSKFVSEAAELGFLEQLQASDASQYCQYQCCKLFHFIKKVYYKKLDKFESLWDQDDANRVWLIGSKVFELTDDLEGRLLSRKIQELRGGKTNFQMKELMQQSKQLLAREKFREGCAEHFARMHKIAAFVHAKMPEQLRPADASHFAQVFEAFYEPHFSAFEKALESDPKAFYGQVLWAVLSISLMNTFPALSFLTNERFLRKFNELPVPKPERLEWRGKPKRRRSLGVRVLSVMQIQQILASVDQKKSFKRFPRFLAAQQSSAESSLVLPKVEVQRANRSTAPNSLPQEAESRELPTQPESQTPQPAPRYPQNIRLYRVASEAGFAEQLREEARLPERSRVEEPAREKSLVFGGDGRRQPVQPKQSFAGGLSLPRILGRDKG